MVEKRRVEILRAYSEFFSNEKSSKRLPAPRVSLSFWSDAEIVKTFQEAFGNPLAVDVRHTAEADPSIAACSLANSDQTAILLSCAFRDFSASGRLVVYHPGKNSFHAPHLSLLREYAPGTAEVTPFENRTIRAVMCSFAGCGDGCPVPNKAFIFGVGEKRLVTCLPELVKLTKGENLERTDQIVQKIESIVKKWRRILQRRFPQSTNLRYTMKEAVKTVLFYLFPLEFSEEDIQTMNRRLFLEAVNRDLVIFNSGNSDRISDALLPLYAPAQPAHLDMDFPFPNEARSLLENLAANPEALKTLFLAKDWLDLIQQEKFADRIKGKARPQKPLPHVFVKGGEEKRRKCPHGPGTGTLSLIHI